VGAHAAPLLEAPLSKEKYAAKEEDEKKTP
jgi:hypothetical protein